VAAMTREEAWSLFFAYGADPKHRDLLGELTAVRREIKMANELLQNISKDEIERAHFRSRKMFQMDMNHNRLVARDEGLAEGLAEGRDEGLAKGLAEGRDEKAMEIAKNMIVEGEPIDKITLYTGLTHSEVENLSANN
jgi:predicted transposase/invertase (TIGR01784 family)